MPHRVLRWTACHSMTISSPPNVPRVKRSVPVMNTAHVEAHINMIRRTAGSFPCAPMPPRARRLLRGCRTPWTATVKKAHLFPPFPTFQCQRHTSTSSTRLSGRCVFTEEGVWARAGQRAEPSIRPAYRSVPTGRYPPTISESLASTLLLVREAVPLLYYAPSRRGMRTRPPDDTHHGHAYRCKAHHYPPPAHMQVARLFGFQVFNRATAPSVAAAASGSPPSSPLQWTPATAFVAGDHLTALLRDGALRR